MAIRSVSARKCPKGAIQAALFDFDGTLSTLRHGWEKVMKALMVDCLGKFGSDAGLSDRIDRYIDQSTGIQTIFQMEWLAAQVAAQGGQPEGRDAWWYKDEYNRRLMAEVQARVDALKQDASLRSRFLVRGSESFLKALRDAGVRLFLASGTDHADVVREAEALGMAEYFSVIRGAPERRADCSKEAVLSMILDGENLQPGSLLLVGDGKVEISLGVSRGAYALGIASNEAAGQGVNPVKERRLVAAGADWIAGDFSDTRGLMETIGF